MIKLIVDCACEIDAKEAKAMGITCMPMRLTFDDQEYLAGTDLDNNEFYNKLMQCKNLPKTSQINAEDYVKVIKPLLDAGDEVYVMAISSGLSGCFNSLQIAAKELNSPKLKIFDTETFTIAYYALVKEAIKCVKDGATLDELDAKMQSLRPKIKLFAIIDNVKYLIKGGRLSFTKGILAMALRIKPIISVINKKLGMVGKAMGYNSAKAQLQGLVKDVDETMPIYYGHGHSPEKAEDFKKAFAYNFAECREIGPIIGTHGGPGCVGLAYFAK